MTLNSEDQEKARQLLIKFGSFEQNEVAINVIDNKLGKPPQETLDALIHIEQLIFAVNVLAELEVNLEKIERQKKIDEYERQKQYDLFKQFVKDVRSIRETGKLTDLS